MATHPNRKRAQGPRCLCCAKPIRKSTTTVYAPGPPGQPIAGWQYQGNGIVCSQRYADVYISGGEPSVSMGEEAPATVTERRLWNVAVWDGESYAPFFRYFCSNHCASDFGKKAAEAGYRVKQPEPEPEPV